jgi:hypothetical protein
MKLCVATYLPPPSFGCAKVFVENLELFPPRVPLLAYSDHPWPGAIALKGNPEQVKRATFANGKINPFAINNLLWLTGLRIARDQGYSHMLYLEHDCRVGVKNWDDRIFEEYFSIGRPLVAGGNLACYNPCNHSPEAARRWQKLVAGNVKRNLPIPTYGWMGASNQGPSCVFTNGALAIYDVAWMGQMFDLSNTMDIAAAESAFDMVLGVRIWDIFFEDSYEVFGHLDSVFSGYGDVLSTEEERLQWLREGRYVGVHQVKSQATV